jgi:hypothetical protein
MEAGLISFIAFLVSILFIQLLNTGVGKSFFQADLSLSKNINLLLSVAGIFDNGFYNRDLSCNLYHFV